MQVSSHLYQIFGMEVHAPIWWLGSSMLCAALPFEQGRDNFFSLKESYHEYFGGAEKGVENTVKLAIIDSSRS